MAKPSISTPWPSEVALGFAQENIEADPEFNGVFIIGCDEVVGITPCIETPRETAAMISLQILAGKLPHPNWTIFVGDTYHIELDNEADHPGSLEDAFKAGDDRVKEAAVVLCVCPDGPSYQAIRTYARTEDGIDWDETEIRESLDGMGGALHHLMMMILKVPHGIDPNAANGIDQLRVPT